MYRIFLFTLAVLGGFLSCSRSAAPVIEQPRFYEKRPVDYVLVVDNSGSIRGYEQVIVREAIKLFADIADSNDRIDLVTFGTGSQIVESRLICGETDRQAFKTAVDRAVTFSEQLSDVRAGIKVIADEKPALFRDAGILRVGIVFTDGFIEVRDRANTRAFEEICRLRDQHLQDIVFYTIGLGRSALDKPIGKMESYTGRGLLKDKLAYPTGEFTELDDVAGISKTFIDIIKTVKGIPEIYEPGSTTFRVDTTIRELKIAIPKRDTSGNRLYSDGSLRIVPPTGEPLTVVTQGGKENVRWPSEYQTLNFITIRSPEAGSWRIDMINEALPPFHVAVKTHLALKTPVRKIYFDREQIIFRPKVINLDRGAADESVYRYSARISGKKIDGGYTPDSIPVVSCGKMAPGAYTIRFFVEKEDSPEFFRASQEYSFTVVSSPFSYKFPESRAMLLVPLLTKALLFKVTGNSLPEDAHTPAVRWWELSSKGVVHTRGTRVMEKGTSRFSASVVPKTGGIYRTEIVIPWNNSGDSVEIISPPFECTVSDLRIAVFTAVAGVILVIIRWVICMFLAPFGFSAVVRYGGKRASVDVEQKRRVHELSVPAALEKKAADAPDIRIKLRSVRGLLHFNGRSPFITVTGPGKISVDDDEYSGEVRIHAGSQIIVRTADGNRLIIEISNLT